MDAIREPTITPSVAMLFPNHGVQGKGKAFSAGDAFLARLFVENRRNGRMILSLRE
jgi:hypothetical protein